MEVRIRKSPSEAVSQRGEETDWEKMREKIRNSIKGIVSVPLVIWVIFVGWICCYVRTELVSLWDYEVCVWYSRKPILDMQKSSETASGTVAYIFFFTTSKVAQGVFVCIFKAYMHIQNILLYQGTVLPSNQEISKKKGLHCYFGSPISFLKIGSRAKELNVMSATAEAIHGPWMNTFMVKWQIKSNCLFSDFRQSLIHVKEVGV